MNVENIEDKKIKEYEEITLHGDNQRSIKFKGVQLIEQYSSSNNANSRYSGETGISHEIDLYKTNTGKFVIQYKMQTEWQGAENITKIYHGNDLLKITESLKEYEYSRRGEYSRCLKWFMREISTLELIEPEEI